MLEYPYKRIKGVSLPLIPVVLRKTDGTQLPPVLALVDSGAGISLFDADMAALLEIDIPTGTYQHLGGIKDGLDAYVHVVDCTVG